jgi:serine/threonine-protein kinase
MGAVYDIEHAFTHHRRALKLLHREVAENPGIVARFLREASAAGRIGNPHVVETFDAGTLDSGEPYLVMELLAGQTLTELLESRGPLPPGEIEPLMLQACSGVQAAHDAGIVHRDLKPDNLFITERDDAPFVKILDFGISKFDTTLTGDHGLTREGSLLGTPYYMPPEQVRGAAVDERADVYALGVILYECLTGTKPFEADTLPHLSVKIHEGKATPVTELRPDIPQALAAVVVRAMQADRDQRFGSVRELAAALERCTDASTGPAPLPFEQTECAPAGSVPGTLEGAAQAGSMPGTLDGAASAPARRPGSAWKVGVAALAVVVIGVVWTLTRPHATEAPEPEHRAAAASSSDAPLGAAPPATPRTPSVTPTTATSAVPPASASAAPVPTPAKVVAHTAAPAPSPRPKPRASTKASKAGLVEGNPYQ